MLVLHDGNPLVHIRRPWVNQVLVALMILGFGAQYLGLFAWQYFAFFPNQVFTGSPDPGPFYGLVGLVTHMFLHGGFLHLIGNLIALWVFGDNIEDAMGHGRYLIFFLATGIAAALTQGWFGHPFAPMIGASGAVSGVMGAYLLLHPRARILILAFNVVPILAPASIVVGIDLLLNAVMAWDVTFLGSPEGAGIAWYAHIGGFVSGILLVLVMRSRDVMLFQPAPAIASRSMRWLARFIPTLVWPGERPVADEMAGGTTVRREGWTVFAKALIYIVLIFLLMRYVG
jgi:membrane associated rhomboid family serine protease